MAQFDFLGTWKDSWALLGAILGPGDTFLVPDLNYPKPAPLVFSTLGETQKDTFQKNRSLFVGSSAFTKHPPFLQKTARTYRVDVSEEGPLLHLVLPASYRYERGVPKSAFEGGAGLNLAPGMLSHQPHYLNPETGTWEAASEELKAGYQEMVRRIKTQLVRHQFHRFIWTGHDALQEIQVNQATIHGFGLDGWRPEAGD